MSGPLDANIKIVYPVDVNTDFALDAIKSNAPFEVVANVEVGSMLRSHGPKQTLTVWLKNLSQSTTLARASLSSLIPDQPPGPHNEVLRVAISNWAPNAGEADPDDVLVILASYRVASGANIDQSIAESTAFIVKA